MPKFVFFLLPIISTITLAFPAQALPKSRAETLEDRAYTTVLVLKLCEVKLPEMSTTDSKYIYFEGYCDLLLNEHEELLTSMGHSQSEEEFDHYDNELFKILYLVNEYSK